MPKPRPPATPPEEAASSGAGRWLALSALLLALAAFAWWALSDRGLGLVSRADQNVLLITIDSLRADALSGAGGEAPTPILDQLAAEGVRFSFAHGHATTTVPAHASLLTGQLPPAHGVRDDVGYQLEANAETIASRLESAGFATAAFVASGVLDSGTGLDRGFDVYDDRMSSRADPLSLQVPERSGEAVVRSATTWIAEQPDRWFAWVHLAEPHAPYAAGEATGPSDPYAAEVARADAALGPLLAALRTGPRPTFVVVTADHGEGLGNHAEETHGLFAYETTLRVPLILTSVDPERGAIGGGLVVDGPARHIDILPTVLAAVDLPVAPELPGRSLDDLLRGDQSAPRPVYFEALSASLRRNWAPLRGIIDGGDKLIDLPIPELYDLGADPGELRNLAQVDTVRADELRRLLTSMDTSAPSPAADTTADVYEHLRSVGYVNARPSGDAPDTEADDPKRLVELDRLMDAALLAVEQARFEDAANALQQVVVDRPRNAEAYQMLALVFWEGGLPNQAIATLRAALNVGLTEGGTRLKLARMLALTGGGESTVRLLEDATGTPGSPAEFEALGALGIAYTQLGRSADAERVFDRLIAGWPQSAVGHESLGILRLRQDRLADAEASLRRAIDLEPFVTGAYTPLGVALSDQGRIEEAVDVWTQAVQIDDAEFLALFNLTFALASLDRTDEARLRGEQFLRTAPPSLYAGQLAQVRSLLGGQ